MVYGCTEEKLAEKVPQCQKYQHGEDNPAAYARLPVLEYDQVLRYY